MVEENPTTLYFYRSKVKNILITIFGVVFLAGGVAMCYTAFKNEAYLTSLLGGVMAIFLALLIPLMIFRIIKPIPFVVLTEKELMMNPGAKKPIRIEWEDVEGYRIREFHTQYNTLTFIEIILYDEEKYKAQMSEKQRKFNVIGTMGGKYSLFSIYLEQIKITERDLLLYALDNITSPDFDVENVPKSNITEKMDSFTNQINQEYFMKNYLLSLVITIFSMLLLYSDSNEMSSLNYVITSFVLFPFGKLMFDVMIGFKFKSFIKKQSNTNYYVYQLINAIIYFILFFVSPFVGPIGILFLITRALHRWNKKRNEHK